MVKKDFIIIFSVLLCFFSFVLLSFSNKKNNDIKELTATVLQIKENQITLQDSQNVIYTFDIDDIDFETGEILTLKYTGLIDANSILQDGKVISYKKVSLTDSEIPSNWLDNGIFKDYYKMAYNKLKTLSLSEKIGQILLVRYPDTSIQSLLQNYPVSGFVFFEKDFKDKTLLEVQDMIQNAQKNSKIPLLTAVDEEGGKIVRISSNVNLVASPFKSSYELYETGGFEKIKEDTIYKSKILSNLGINLNLAPVIDVTTDPSAYMYERSFRHNTELTSTYAKTVIEASKDTKVSYTLKHFPGYANNSDTHISSATDDRSYEDILNNDIPPFKEGIKSGAEAILFSHNIVKSIDSNNPVSLSINAHNLLRNELDFTGIIVTDNLDMSALSNIDKPILKALLAGNDLIITTDYKSDFQTIKDAITDGTISEQLINKLAFRVLAWKYYKGLIMENQK